MAPRRRTAAAVLLAVLLAVTPALAHVPLFVRDGPAARYYRFRMEEGERIYATLQVPRAGGFVVARASSRT
ncbi:MAG: hypothetical protein PWR21_418 [Methanoculleus sp.]|nr:hypothetical protein [Methanoculleus sp.]